MAAMRLVAIGDSFTEGVGDELGGGTMRGWADLVATGIAMDRGAPVEYANLAIRGRLVEPIVREQLEPALALEPTVLTFNGGGNDRLHLNAAGHRRVAARVLQALGHAFPEEWMVTLPGRTAAPNLVQNVAYYRRYVVPWIRRRLTGRSSGDGRQPKHSHWQTVGPRPAG